MISVREYLHAAYNPDCDLVDGEIELRNVGELDHSDVQTALATWFRVRRKQLGIWVVVEQRVRISNTRYRIPDVCVTLGGRPTEQGYKTPPFLCVEILSPEDRMPRVQNRIDDYLQAGVKFVWLINPVDRRAWIYTNTTIEEAKDGVLRTQSPDLSVPLKEIFEDE